LGKAISAFLLGAGCRDGCGFDLLTHFNDVVFLDHQHNRRVRWAFCLSVMNADHADLACLVGIVRQVEFDVLLAAAADQIEVAVCIG